MMGTDRNNEQRTTEAAREQPGVTETKGPAWGGTTSAEEAAPVEAAAPAERLVAAEAEIARLKDEYLRALAETENVRRTGGPGSPGGESVRRIVLRP